MSGRRPRARQASPYSGRRIALLTRHGKERAIAPVLEPALGCRIELVEGFDTDRLGTFTRDIPREGTQLEAARRKARIGMELSGARQGLASEGSFGPDPFTGLFPWNRELLVFIDDLLGIELVGQAQGKAMSAHRVVEDWAAAEAFARAADFPSHQLVLRPDGHDSDIRKGISDWAALQAAYAKAARRSVSGRVLLEVDLRAHANPTRMDNIRLAAGDLSNKLLSQCPACGVPGFWIVEHIAGLPCGDCGAPTHEARGEVHACVKCPHRVSRERGGAAGYADPGRCDYCNP